MTLGEDTVPAFNLKLHLMRSGGTDVIARGNACFKLKRLFVNVFFNEVAKALQFFKRQLSQVTAAAACFISSRLGVTPGIISMKARSVSLTVSMASKTGSLSSCVSLA